MKRFGFIGACLILVSGNAFGGLVSALNAACTGMNAQPARTLTEHPHQSRVMYLPSPPQDAVRDAEEFDPAGLPALPQNHPPQQYSSKITKANPLEEDQ